MADSTQDLQKLKAVLLEIAHGDGVSPEIKKIAEEGANQFAKDLSKKFNLNKGLQESDFTQRILGLKAANPQDKKYLLDLTATLKSMLTVMYNSYDQAQKNINKAQEDIDKAEQRVRKMP